MELIPELVHYVVERGSTASDFTFQEISYVEEQFNLFQKLESTDIPAEVTKDAKILTIHRDWTKTSRLKMDKTWVYLYNLTDHAGMNTDRQLATVALAVLILPHSNASEEKCFLSKKN